MIASDLPPKLWTPPALILPGEAETLDRALRQAGAPRHMRRAIESEITRSLGSRSQDILSRVKRDADEASMPVLLALLAARRRRTIGPRITDFSVVATPAADPTDTTSYDFGTLAFGDAPGAGEKRYIGAAVGSAHPNNSTVLTGIPIGGSAGTLAVKESGTNNTTTGIFYREVSDGTTGNVTVTFDQPQWGVSITVYRIIITDDGVIAVFDTDTDADADADHIAEFSYDVAANSVAIASGSGVSGASPSWSGLGGNNPRDVQTNEWVDQASNTYSSASSGVTASADFGGSANPVSGCLAVFHAVAP